MLGIWLDFFLSVVFVRCDSNPNSVIVIPDRKQKVGFSSSVGSWLADVVIVFVWGCLVIILSFKYNLICNWVQRCCRLGFKRFFFSAPLILENKTRLGEWNRWEKKCMRFETQKLWILALVFRKGFFAFFLCVLLLDLFYLALGFFFSVWFFIFCLHAFIFSYCGWVSDFVLFI